MSILLGISLTQNYSFKQYWKVFPEYRGVFRELYSKVSLRILKEFKASVNILETSEDKLANHIADLCKSRSEKWAYEKAQKLKEAASRNPF